MLGTDLKGTGGDDEKGFSGNYFFISGPFFAKENRAEIKPASDAERNWFGSTVTNTLLNSQKQNKIILRWRLFYLATGIPLGVLLIPRYGILGFQATTIIAPNVGILYAIWWTRKNLHIKLDVGNTLKILVSTIIGYISCQTVLSLVDLNPWFELILGGTTLAITYMITIMLTGALSAKNINDIKTITDRYQPTRWILDPILSQLLRIAKE